MDVDHDPAANSPALHQTIDDPAVEGLPLALPVEHGRKQRWREVRIDPYHLANGGEGIVPDIEDKVVGERLTICVGVRHLE